MIGTPVFDMKEARSKGPASVRPSRNLRAKVRAGEYRGETRQRAHFCLDGGRSACLKSILDTAACVRTANALQLVRSAVSRHADCEFGSRRRLHRSRSQTNKGSGTKMERENNQNDPMTTEHEIVSSTPIDESREDRRRDAGQIRTSGRDDRSQSAGRMPARRNE